MLVEQAARIAKAKASQMELEHEITAMRAEIERKKAQIELKELEHKLKQLEAGEIETTGVEASTGASINTSTNTSSSSSNCRTIKVRKADGSI